MGCLGIGFGAVLPDALHVPWRLLPSVRTIPISPVIVRGLQLARLLHV